MTPFYIKKCHYTQTEALNLCYLPVLTWFRHVYCNGKIDYNIIIIKCKKKEILHLLSHYFLGTSFSVPPMYGLNASGIETVPSSFKLFSKNAINILGGATTVLFKVCA